MFDFNLPVAAIPADYREFLPTMTTPAVDELLQEYAHGEAEMRRMHDYLMQVENQGTLSSFAYGAQAYYQSSSRSQLWVMDLIDMFDLKRAMNARQEHFWFRLFDLCSLTTVLPTEIWTKWQESFTAWRTRHADIVIPQFDHTSVYSCLSLIESHRANFLSMRVDAVWKALSGWHKTNWGGAFHDRFIIDWMFNESGTTTSKDRSFIDLVNVCSTVMTGAENPFFNAYGELRHARDQHGEWHELLDGALRIKAFKRGTLHCEIHPEISNRLNIALAYLHPNALPDEATLKRPRRRKGFGSAELLNLAVPHQVRGYLAECYEQQGANGLWQLKSSSMIKEERIGNAVRMMIDNVLVQIGGVRCEGAHLFDYAPMDVIKNIVRFGEVPEKISHQYYSTPQDLAMEFVAWSGVHDSDICYETSAGTGGIAKHMPLQTSCVEVDRLRCMSLDKMGFEVKQGDFLMLSPTDLEGEADAVLMNPPFAGRAWQDHFEHAAHFVREGGLVAAILPSGAPGKMPMLSDVAVEYSENMDSRFPDTSISVVFARWRKPSTSIRPTTQVQNGLFDAACAGSDIE
ncbi:DUF4942 domain-containing protein (plasmid) [Halopseudomonas sp. SMJS2]|uniref:DUF4942 domain-containing protein n=1 Tax=Halopseudomonas sp. SMJS2 TaxID=3041098 RepID=UPI0024532BE5|nr:DUF4942 domain-containing protein [Halopseudomonas sp. SMJS2]WGK63560.1 DUF4942 domain-containing protein [Halopseudomonas sp. SMJS2]